MKITLCLSIKFFPQMLQIKDQLQALGHEVLHPPHEVPMENGKMMNVLEYYQIRHSDQDEKWIWEMKKKAIEAHFAKIEQGEVILVLNYEKNGVLNYVGANTLLEMGLAFYLKKPIFLLNPIPEGVGYVEEIKGLHPIVINGDLKLIK